MIVNKLEKEMAKQTDISSSEQKKTYTYVTFEEEQYKDDVELLIPQPRLESVKLYENTPLILYYTYFMNANSNIFFSPIISQPYP